MAEDRTNAEYQSADDLQFNTAEPASVVVEVGGGGQNCVACKQPITDEYYALQDMTLCPNCCAQVLAPPAGNSAIRVIAATLMGLGAGLVGALIWFVVRRVANMELGLVALVVGYFVGKAVRKGSGNRGGLGYQILAVVLTYCCIAANYMPDIVERILVLRNEAAVAKAAKGNPPAGAVVNPAAGGNRKAGKLEIGVAERIELYARIGIFAFRKALIIPFRGGAQNIIGLLIIGFALWEAWKFNAYRQLPISGPYRLGPRPAV